MGGYGDSSEEDRKKKKKKKKRSHSRSREGSRDSSISSKKSSKHKTKKKKHRSRSRSVEKSYSRKRSRSLSRDRGYDGSRPDSRDGGRRKYDRRSRSRSWDREKHRYSRSRSRDRRSRSRDRRSRSRSRDRRRDRDRDRRSRSLSRDSRLDDLKREKDDPCANVPGFFDMLPADQAKVRMQLALRAAAAADEKLKEQGVLLHPKSTMSAGELKKFNESVENIEAESFAPAVFLSTRENPLTTHDDDGSGRTGLEKTHDDAIFGLGSRKLNIKLDESERTKVVYSGAASLAHPNLHKTPEEKMGRWLAKLTAMRKRKLEGEAMA